MPDAVAMIVLWGSNELGSSMLPIMMVPPWVGVPASAAGCSVVPVPGEATGAHADSTIEQITRNTHNLRIRYFSFKIKEFNKRVHVLAHILAHTLSKDTRNHHCSTAST